MPNIRVLLIEDDKVDQMAFSRMVKEENLPFDYKITDSLTEAKELLGSERFDVIIIDYKPGNDTGLDILDMKTDIPVIVITGSEEEVASVEAMKSGDYDYLIKDAEGRYLRLIPVIIEKAIKLHDVEKEKELYCKELRSLASISNTIVGSPLAENIYDTICDVALKNFDIDMVWLGIRREDSKIITEGVGRTMPEHFDPEDCPSNVPAGRCSYGSCSSLKKQTIGGKGFHGLIAGLILRNSARMSSISFSGSLAKSKIVSIL